MEFPKKQLLVVGDRVLITPEDGDERTRVGLYLPATAIDAQQVLLGKFHQPLVPSALAPLAPASA